MRIPPILQSGDSASWHDGPQVINAIVYRSAGFSLKYSLRGPSVLDLTAVINGEGWQTSIGMTASANLAPGAYRWAAYLSSADQRITAGAGDLKITPNIALLPAGATALSFYEQALADAEKALADFSASGGKPKEYVIGDRRMTFSTLKEIQDALAYWNACVLYENTPDLLAQGLGNPRKNYILFR